jgi:hypothetical protein
MGLSGGLMSTHKEHKLSCMPFLQRKKVSLQVELLHAAIV